MPAFAQRRREPHARAENIAQDAFPPCCEAGDGKRRRKTIMTKETHGTLFVTGTGRLQVTPDEALISLGVLSDEKAPAEAGAEAGAKGVASAPAEAADGQGAQEGAQEEEPGGAV